MSLKQRGKIIHEEFMKIIADEISRIKDALKLIHGEKYKNKERHSVIENIKDIITENAKDENDKNVEIKGDPIIQIGTVFYDYGLSEDSGKDPWYRNILVIGPNDNMKDEEICDKMENLNIDVVPCKDEKDLLIKWSELIKEYDPDFITGYNIFRF